jgi:hypothetical protein
MADRSIDSEGSTVAQYPGRPEFEANADRARESAETLLATSLAAEAASERQSEQRNDGDPRGPVLALIESFIARVRSAVSGLRGR